MNRRKRRKIALEKVRTIRDCVKEIIGCMDCGTKYSAPKLTFDHCRGEKKKEISDIRGVPSLRREIAKCDVVCRPCHDIREIKRGTHGFPYSSLKCNIETLAELLRRIEETDDW